MQDVRRVGSLYLFGVADSQLAGHILQLDQGIVQVVLPTRGFRLGGRRLGQRAQQPQNGQNLLRDLRWERAEMNYNNHKAVS